MKNKQRLTAMLLAGCLAVSSVPVAFAVDAPERQEQVADQAREDSKTAAPTEGACGENATWKLENGTLTISGTGEMKDYSSSNMPWYDSRSSITKVVVEQGITSISGWAFYNCSNLSSVIIPNSVTRIGEDVFSSCSSLSSMTIPDSVTSIGNAAFEGCSGLNSVTIPNSVTSIGTATFEDCGSLSSVTIPNSVTSIGHFAFSGCSSLSGMIIPNSVTSIGSYAFSGCSSLSNVTIGSGVTSIENFAFSDCNSLTNIIVSEQNKNYSSGNGVLFNKNKTKLVSYPGGKNGSYSIPNSVTSIGHSAFSGCSGLSNVTIPDSVTSIGEYAFYNCSSLGSVTIPNSVTSVGEYTFYNCSGLSSVMIPDSVTSIGDFAFEECSSLTSITIPDSVMSIGYGAFLGCFELKHVIIPTTTSVGEHALGMGYNEDTGEYYVIDGFVATVTEGSDGERYCKENGIKYETSHSFTNYVYNNDAQVGKDGTETATCDNGCGTTDTRIKKGTALPEPTTSVTELFCDVPSSAWYVDYVQFVYDNGLMNGTSETTFEPETTLSRAMVAQILYNRAGKPDVSGEAKFNDVPKDQWYYQAVQWAGEQGIVNGVGDGKFAPQADVTREQLAMMLYNAQGKPETDGSLSGFEDTNTISDWAVSAVKWAVNEKIINGSKENEKLYINPMGNATRAEAATMFTRYDQEFD